MIDFLKYKAWVKQNYNCVITGNTKFEQHHLFPIGAGGNRKKNTPRHLSIINLRHDLHREIESIGYEKFCAKYGIDLYKQSLRQIVNYMEKENE
jgi:hypothetical protein